MELRSWIEPDPDIPTRNDIAAIKPASSCSMTMRPEIDSRHTSCAIYDNVTEAVTCCSIYESKLKVPMPPTRCGTG
jgi:hypothetical protein